jgi:hypothetical protein
MKLKRLDTPEGRYYVYSAGKNANYADGTLILMPSVTTILGQLDSQRLINLEKEIGKEALAEIGQKAMRRGTAMHLFLENYLICLQKDSNHDKSLLYTQKKTPTDLRNEGLAEESINMGRNLFYNYVHEGYLERIKRVLLTEKFVWSLKNRFAGTLDFGFLSMLNQIVISDFKSANGIKDEETIHKYYLQLAAYIIAFEEIYNKRVSHAELWISNPHGIQERILEGTELEEMKAEFIELSNQYHRNWNPEEIIAKYYRT